MDTRTITVVLYPEAQSKHYDLIESLGRSNGLEVSERHEGKRVVKLTGPVDKLINLFTQKLPDELHKAVAAILGFNENPVAKTKIRPAKSDNPSPMTPTQVAQHYDFPSDVDGSGQTIAIIELGGGYQATDLITYWQKLGIKNPPVVSSIAVDGVGNSPSGDPDGADGEVMLDIEVSGAVAPGAHIAVYFAPNTDQGFLDAINTAIHDGQNKPSVVSISWGGPESGWADQAKTAMNLAFQDAAKLGITVLVAAGDNGSSDGGEGVNVDFPSSSPFVTSCGGTRLIGDGDKIIEEVAWNDGSEGGATGGGVSVFFPVPEWQKGKTDKVKKGSKLLTGRGVPDVAGNADPESGYEVIVDGQSQVIGGTSAVAPLYAGLVALLNQKLGKSLGYLNPTLYAAPSSVFHDITCGDNGNYICTSGWDSVTGLGSINGKAAEFFLK